MPSSCSPRLHHRHSNTLTASSSSCSKQNDSARFFSLRPSSFPILFLLVLCVVGLSLLRYHALPFASAASKPEQSRIQPTETDRRCLDHSQHENGSDSRSRKSNFQNGGLCNFAEGKWTFDSSRRPLYSQDCPFQRNAWNCGRNRRPGLDKIFQWRWFPHGCSLPVINPQNFLSAIRNMKIGFVGDSLNENFLVSLLCILRTADQGAYRWKKKGAWRGAYFPKYNVTVGYHRAVLLAEYYKWQPGSSLGHLEQLGFTRGVRVDVDVPAGDWVNATEFYDIFVFNTGHWWGLDKFPLENPLLFHKQGKPLIPPLGLQDGLKLVLQHMIPYMERTITPKALKIWRMQSPRHFEGGEWNQNGSCLSNKLLNESQVEEWFGLGKEGVNREAREVNTIIKHALKNSSFHVLNVSHLSEFRADAHPAIWLGQKSAHIIWGQDCLHWCLPGLPDIWVDILSVIILDYFDLRQTC